MQFYKKNHTHPNYHDLLSVKGTKFIALADYNAMGNSEISMREGATVELKKLGCAGWVYVRKLGRFGFFFFFPYPTFTLLCAYCTI
jgi:hypothetical protein